MSGEAAVTVNNGDDLTKPLAYASVRDKLVPLLMQPPSVTSSKPSSSGSAKAKQPKRSRDTATTTTNPTGAAEGDEAASTQPLEDHIITGAGFKLDLNERSFTAFSNKVNWLKLEKKSAVTKGTHSNTVSYYEVLVSLLHSSVSSVSSVVSLSKPVEPLAETTLDKDPENPIIDGDLNFGIGWVLEGPASEAQLEVPAGRMPYSIGLVYYQGKTITWLNGKILPVSDGGLNLNAIQSIRSDDHFGCGYDLELNSVFFTHNQAMVGAVELPKDLPLKWTARVITHTTDPALSVNLVLNTGLHPFTYPELPPHYTGTVVSFPNWGAKHDGYVSVNPVTIFRRPGTHVTGAMASAYIPPLPLVGTFEPDTAFKELRRLGISEDSIHQILSVWVCLDKSARGCVDAYQIPSLVDRAKEANHLSLTFDLLTELGKSLNQLTRQMEQKPCIFFWDYVRAVVKKLRLKIKFQIPRSALLVKADQIKYKDFDAIEDASHEEETDSDQESSPTNAFTHDLVKRKNALIIFLSLLFFVFCFFFCLFSLSYYPSVPSKPSTHKIIYVS